MINSLIKHTAQQSILQNASILDPKGGSRKRNIVADLLLTALIDAFSILVIFLLMNFSSTGEILFINKGMELPKATQADFLDRNPVVKIDQGKIYLEEKEVAINELTASLIEIKKKFEDRRQNAEASSVITVQADRRVKYETLNQVVVAAAQSGMSDIKFAILMK